MTIDQAPTSRLERSQEARRNRVMAAVLELAAEGGYDAVQLRAISDRTGVGLDTIYRYFGSRDGLLSATFSAWLDREFVQPAPSWMEGKTAAERVLAVTRHIWEYWERNPGLLEPYIRTAQAEGHDPEGLSARSRALLGPHLQEALEPVDSAVGADLGMIIGELTHSAMTWVVRGEIEVKDVYPMLERALRRLIEHPALDGQRPSSWDYRPGRRRRS